MSLSCSCGEGDLEKPGDWLYYNPDDFEKLETKRRRRCASCGKLIDVGSECLRFSREQYSDWGPIYKAPLYQCVECGEIWLNLNAAGFCNSPYDEMPQALLEYWELTGFEPADEKIEAIVSAKQEKANG